MTANTNAMITELNNFLKVVFNDFTHFIGDINSGTYNLYDHNDDNDYYNHYVDNYYSAYEQLQNIGYDGTLASVVCADSFWNIIMRDLVGYIELHQWLCEYKFTIIEKTNECIRGLIDPEFYTDKRDVNHNLSDYILFKWDSVFKEPLREWAQSEYCVYIQNK